MKGIIFYLLVSYKYVYLPIVNPKTNTAMRKGVSVPILFAMMCIADILSLDDLEKTTFEEVQAKTRLDFSNGRGDGWKKQITDAHEWLMNTEDAQDIVFGFAAFIGYIDKMPKETNDWVEGMWDIYEAADVPKLITMSIHTAFFG